MNLPSLDQMPCLFRFAWAPGETTANAVEQKINDLGVQWLLCTQQDREYGVKEWCLLLYGSDTDASKHRFNHSFLATPEGAEALTIASWKDIQEHHKGDTDAFFARQGYLFEYLLRFHQIDLRKNLLEYRSKVWEESLGQQWCQNESSKGSLKRQNKSRL